jgi:hypothetical protein
VLFGIGNGVYHYNNYYNYYYCSYVATKVSTAKNSSLYYASWQLSMMSYIYM